MLQNEDSSTKNKSKIPAKPKSLVEKPVEIGGREGPDPTRYGDWENNGKCVDF